MIDTKLPPHAVTIDGDRWTCLCGATTTGTDSEAAADAHLDAASAAALLTMSAEGLGALLTATAAGRDVDRHRRAATVALVDHGHWLRSAAVCETITIGWDTETGQPGASVLWWKLADVRRDGRLRGSSSELGMLDFALSLAGVAHGVDLGDLISRLGPNGKKDIQTAVNMALGL